MKENIQYNTKVTSVITGIICFLVCVFMLYFRPKESWYDDAFWADWALKLSQGNFITNVWGGGQPSYSPLYAIILAGWYKIVGFSFFAAQFPNLCFALATYLIICLDLPIGQFLNKKVSAIAFAICFWFADVLFWIFNCGRVDTLCLLLGILSIVSFVKAYETHSTKHVLLMCLWSFLIMATGFEGVLFTAVIIIIYSLMDIHTSIRRWKLYLVYIISSIASFIAVVAWMAYHNCGKAFLRTLFGFSYTLNSIINFIETGHLTFENKVPIKKSMSIQDIFYNMTIDGILDNKEYVFFALVIIGLLIALYALKKLNWKRTPPIVKALIISSIIVPWIYILAGRYAIYYTWAGYVPAIISFFILVGKSKYEVSLSTIAGCIILVWFCVCPEHTDFKRVDFTRKIDKQNLHDIQMAQINKNESTYIPYKWYYYLASENENLYFLGSGRYPKNMTKMIFSTDNEVKEWNETLELEFMYDIGTKKLYKVLGDKGKNILR